MPKIHICIFYTHMYVNIFYECERHMFFLNNKLLGAVGFAYTLLHLYLHVPVCKYTSCVLFGTCELDLSLEAEEQIMWVFMIIQREFLSFLTHNV